MTRREFLHLLAIAAASGVPLDGKTAAAGNAVGSIYDLPKYGNNVTLLHFTDCHAQLLPIYFREPAVNIGVGASAGQPPHLVGEALLKYFNISHGTRLAHAVCHLEFEKAAAVYGKVGGFAHLATLIKHVRAQRPGALLLDGGDSWQGSATALWTKGQDMIEACKLLGVDVMTGHWEFTHGAERVKQVVDRELKGSIEFVAQNVATADFGDPVFKPFVLREVNGVPIAIVGQAFPYVPIAHPRRFVPDWTFGIQEEQLQKTVNAARAKGAQVIILLSHNGMDVDLKLATRVTGIDVILGGHTHDAVPDLIAMKNAAGTTLVGNAGSNGKFLAVLDLDVRNRQLRGYQYRVLPVFANLLPPDKQMDALIESMRAPYLKQLNEPLAVTQTLLYRRGNFNGTFDQVILDALLQMKGAQIAFSPGFRWGPTLLPKTTITMEHLLDQTAITYPYTTLTDMTGAQIKDVLEDICDNLFNPDPYLQQGGDMVRVGGLQYSCNPSEKIGRRIGNLTLAGAPIDPNKHYKVAGWAPVGESTMEQPIWDVVAQYLRDKKAISAVKLNVPRIEGVQGNAGLG